MRELIEKLIDEIGPGHMDSSAYDTAWTARLGELDWHLSSKSLAWLAENQLADGSWGARVPFYHHDRVICTLAAMIALSYCGRRGHDKVQVERGRAALERIVGGATEGLQADPNGATVGFEMIAPTLAAEAEKLGLIKNQGDRILGRLSKQRTKKLNYLQNNMINKYVTMAFCAEMAGSDGKHMLDMENLQEENGSIGVSPSATAYFANYVKRGDEASLNYLRGAIKPDGGMPNVTPINIFETAWSLWNLSLIPDLKKNEKLQLHLDLLSRTWQPKRGIGHSEYFSVKDSDDTSVVYEVLSRFGIEKDLASVLVYEEADYFRCFDLEANPSVSANIHVLGALGQAGLTKTNPSVEKILHYLEKAKGSNPYWVDKWHSSPYYVTSHAIIACAGLAEELVERSVQWILDTQNIDGSWGAFLPTAEETAYAIQALWVWKEKVARIPEEAIQDGARWLKEHMEQPYPPLWIGKCLYKPNLVIRSAVLSALALAQ